METHAGAWTEQWAWTECKAHKLMLKAHMFTEKIAKNWWRQNYSNKVQTRSWGFARWSSLLVCVSPDSCLNVSSKLYFQLKFLLCNLLFLFLPFYISLGNLTMGPKSNSQSSIWVVPNTQSLVFRSYSILLFFIKQYKTRSIITALKSSKVQRRILFVDPFNLDLWLFVLFSLPSVSSSGRDQSIGCKYLYNWQNLGKIC